MSRGISSRIATLVPALGWLRGYQPGWLRGDAVAGITLAAYLMPAAIGDASLAGLPPEAGLYACLFSGLVFWLFTSSRQTTVTVTSAIFGCTSAPPQAMTSIGIEPISRSITAISCGAKLQRMLSSRRNLHRLRRFD